MFNEVYEDERPADILSRLVKLGDNQVPPRRWRAWVDNEQRLRFEPRGSGGVAWYVDVNVSQLSSFVIGSIRRSKDGSAVLEPEKLLLQIDVMLARKEKGL